MREGAGNTTPGEVDRREQLVLMCASVAEKEKEMCDVEVVDEVEKVDPEAVAVAA